MKEIADIKKFIRAGSDKVKLMVGREKENAHCLESSDCMGMKEESLCTAWKNVKM